jgi:hypothetical protein
MSHQDRSNASYAAFEKLMYHEIFLFSVKPFYVTISFAIDAYRNGEG